jgi:hypothetical protein
MQNLAIARGLLDRYQELWRDRFARMNEVLAEQPAPEQATGQQRSSQP